jgi:hypothetical protein
MDDMVERGRSCFGSSHPNTALGEKQVAEIFQLIAEGRSLSVIANRFNVGRGAIVKIAYGRSWLHVQGVRKSQPSPKTNRFFGVYYNKDKGKWQAQLIINGRMKGLGRFGHELLAACCVNAHIAYLGLNKPLNVIDPDEWKQAGIYD